MGTHAHHAIVVSGFENWSHSDSINEETFGNLRVATWCAQPIGVMWGQSFDAMPVYWVEVEYGELHQRVIASDRRKGGA